MDFPIFNNHATLRFERQELIDDIKNYAYIEGDTMKRDAEHDKHMVFDIAEKGNIDRVTRVLDLTFAQCVELCYPYAKKEVKANTSRDNELEEEDEYVMLLNLPATFSETTVTLLEKYIHEYMVYRVMEDWMGLTKPESMLFWREKADRLEVEIKKALNSRCKAFVRKQHPF